VRTSPAFGPLLTLAFTLSLTACEPGPPLGECRFDGAEIVSLAALPKVAKDDLSHPYAASAKFIRLAFSSPQDVEQLVDGRDLYVDVDFCPFKTPFMIQSSGPYYSDQSRYIFTNATPNVVKTQYRHPPRDPRTGRFLYTAYIYSARPMPGASLARYTPPNPYDLRTTHRDLCVRLDSSGDYVRRASTSEVFVVPRAAIDAAWRRAAS
jgi:hypothetical protein